MDNLRECLEKFSYTTFKLIQGLQGNDFDSIDDFLQIRQDIIEEISKENYNRHEFITLTKELKIMELDNELGSIIKQKKENVKKDIKKLSFRKNANSEYNRYNEKSVIFSKKI